MKRSKTSQKLAAMMTASILTAMSGSAFAQTTSFRGVTDSIVDSSDKIPNLITTVAYISGIGFGVTGIMKLKQHVDSPGNVPMKDGLMRLGAGGGCLALPVILNAMRGTVGQDTAVNNGAATYTDLTGL